MYQFKIILVLVIVACISIVAVIFCPVDFVKKYIDYIALHKMNYFHWHLTEDQGWRIEIKKYPKLTEVGAWRNGTIIGRHPGTGNDNKILVVFIHRMK